ncbi:hypothetical protein H0P51_04285 [Mycobacterium vicinigordonae]|uniref:Uncharacterized protein n=1 Tax=Mycobacterium vicinigordonae TaxID=1719132 RepID=A0A7D6ED46_9MYCO|nr:hypothetical protein H0P51_04285 [Mycobacterium vicinigordonae]
MLGHGGSWLLGTASDVDWITTATTIGRTITSAIPPLYDSYATVVLPDFGAALQRHEQALIELLVRQSAGQPWWLGYLDTGCADIVFPDAPKVTLYAGWPYVLVQAGPEQATDWRRSDHSGNTRWDMVLPDLMFPSDRSWLVSTLWDDDWTCVGGPAPLIDSLLRHPRLDTRRVGIGEDATPPGHRAF